jgi:hypothetical protein
MENADLNSTNISDNNVLVRQQITNAYNEFVQMIESVIMDDESEIKIVLFKNFVPIETTEIIMEDNIPGAKTGIFRCVVYYDPHTLTFRIKGGSYFTYDFTFVSHEIERNRQILEIVHALYVLKYSNGSEEQIKNLTRKFKYLTVDPENSDVIIELSDILDDVSLCEKEKIE